MWVRGMIMLWLRCIQELIATDCPSWWTHPRVPRAPCIPGWLSRPHFKVRNRGEVNWATMVSRPLGPQMKGSTLKKQPLPLKKCSNVPEKKHMVHYLSIFVGDAIGNNPMFGKALRFDSHLGWAGFHHQMDHFGSSPKFITDQSP